MVEWKALIYCFCGNFSSQIIESQSVFFIILSYYYYHYYYCYYYFLLLLQVIPVKVNYNYFIIYKASNLNLK